MKKSNRNLHKTTEKALIGFWRLMKVPDPIGDFDKPVNGKVGHHNGVIAIKIHNDGYYRQLSSVLSHRVMKWRIDIAMEFKKGDKTDFKIKQMVAVCRLPDTNEHYMQTLESMFQDAIDKNYIDDYVITHVYQEVIGRPSDITDDDYKECHFDS